MLVWFSLERVFHWSHKRKWISLRIPWIISYFTHDRIHRLLSLPIRTQEGKISDKTRSSRIKLVCEGRSQGWAWFVNCSRGSGSSRGVMEIQIKAPPFLSIHTCVTGKCISFPDERSGKSAVAWSLKLSETQHITVVLQHYWAFHQSGCCKSVQCHARAAYLHHGQS